MTFWVMHDEPGAVANYTRKVGAETFYTHWFGAAQVRARAGWEYGRIVDGERLAEGFRPLLFEARIEVEKLAGVYQHGPAEALDAHAQIGELAQHFYGEMNRLLAQHDEEEHGGERCEVERANVIAYGIHRLGYNEETLEQIANLVSSYAKDCVKHHPPGEDCSVI